jgi:hypothetical protein
VLSTPTKPSIVLHACVAIDRSHPKTMNTYTFRESQSIYSSYYSMTDDIHSVQLGRSRKVLWRLKIV